MAKRKLKPGDGVIEGIENLKPGEGVNVGDTTYEYGADLSTEGEPLVDTGEGKTISIRTFGFKMNPDPKVRKYFPNDKQLIFNAHARQIATILWGDGLIPLDGVAPRVIINKKKGFYQIFVPCEAKRDVVFMEKPKNLSEELARSSTPKPTGTTGR